MRRPVLAHRIGEQGPLSTSVAVEPGHYPVYRKFDAFCWVMEGRINERMEKLGDGLFGAGIRADMHKRAWPYVAVAAVFAIAGCLLVGIGWTPEHP